MSETSDNHEPTLIERVNEELAELRTFHEEQEVEKRTWRIPSEVYDALRRYIVGKYGTTQHIGAFVTQAMVAWNGSHSDQPSHRTWAHLKNDYDYSETGVNVENWNYRSYVDYGDVPGSEKSPLCFSAPKSVLHDFTRTLEKHEYGNELANAVASELLKQKQIRKMQALLETMANGTVELTRTGDSAEKVEVDASGTPVSLTDLRMGHTTARVYWGDLDGASSVLKGSPKARRGVLAAQLRTLSGTYAKGTIYEISERLGVSSRTTQRKDLKALRDYVRRAGNEEPLRLHPSERVREMQNSHSLPEGSNLMASNQLADKDAMEFNQMNAAFYNVDIISREEVWEHTIDELYHNAELVGEVNWDHPREMCRVYRAVKQRDNLVALLNVLSAYRWVLDDEEKYDSKTAHLSRLDAIIGLLQGEMDFPPDLDERVEHIREKNRDMRHIGRKGGKESSR